MFDISQRIGILLGLASTFGQMGAISARELKSTVVPAEFASTAAARDGAKLFWREPTDIKSRNLFLGSGGAAHQPRGPFTFVKEDLDGTNPKFVVRDKNGLTWKAKLGAEARPETVASRFVWAVGYFTPDEYFLASLPVQQKPKHLRRGGNLAGSGDSFSNVRLKLEQKDEKKVSNWRWRKNRELSERELNGLRVMMALMNNWDLKDENNAVYASKNGKSVDKSSETYMVSDLGATFGASRLGWNHDKSKGNLKAYTKTKFITKTTAEYVDFGSPATPALINVFVLPQFIQRIGLRDIGKRVPRRDALWMGQLLARLSPAQIRDAFRAGGYSPEESSAFARVVEERIAALNKL
jgi:hypothetical protein